MRQHKPQRQRSQSRSRLLNLSPQLSQSRRHSLQMGQLRRSRQREQEALHRILSRGHSETAVQAQQIQRPMPIQLQLPNRSRMFEVGTESCQPSQLLISKQLSRFSSREVTTLLESVS